MAGQLLTGGGENWRHGEGVAVALIFLCRRVEEDSLFADWEEGGDGGQSGMKSTLMSSSELLLLGLLSPSLDEGSRTGQVVIWIGGGLAHLVITTNGLS